jgi:hypothetical protein
VLLHTLEAWYVASLLLQRSGQLLQAVPALAMTGQNMYGVQAWSQGAMQWHLYGQDYAAAQEA